MDGPLELVGSWLAWAYAIYGAAFLLVPALLFGHTALLGAVVWGVRCRSRERKPWPWMPAGPRKWGRLGVEIAYGLINPALYLAILVASQPRFPFRGEWWFGALTTAAWILLVAFWAVRIFGAGLPSRFRVVGHGVRALLGAALACVLLFAVKDAWALATQDEVVPAAFLSIVARVGALYLIPAVLLIDHLRSTSADPASVAAGGSTLFLLPDGAARAAMAVGVAVALATAILAAQRSSDASVRELVREHREDIRAAAIRYDVDPRLIAAILYVSHRDQLSPFRGALERLVMSAWTRGQWIELGANETLLNRPLDISVGLTQIKPRTAQTASLLAAGRAPGELPEPFASSYRDAEPAGSAWALPVLSRMPTLAPFPVPAPRVTVARALLDARSNLETCALILALYQRQWESANPAWTLRGRPEILATLYQIGFARSTPHAAPQANDFGRRVREITEQPWLNEALRLPAVRTVAPVEKTIRG
jgi:hypothetical protein